MNATVETTTVETVKAKATKVIAPSLGEFLSQVLRDAESQVSAYIAKLPETTRRKVTNGKAGLRITDLHDSIAADDAHGQAMLVSAKCAARIREALELASNLKANRSKAMEKAGKK